MKTSNLITTISIVVTVISIVFSCVGKPQTTINITIDGSQNSIDLNIK